MLTFCSVEINTDFSEAPIFDDYRLIIAVMLKILLLCCNAQQYKCR